jgi:choline-sulfatase
MKKPNLLFLMSDQHAAHMMGCAGNAESETPNLDRLAAGGVRFHHAYCANPHCVPSRAALMTGLQAYRIPCYSHAAPFPSELPTWAHMFRSHGYATELNGKMHMVGPDNRHGFHRLSNEQMYEISGFRWGEENPNPALGKEYWVDLHFEESSKYKNVIAGMEMEIRDRAVAFLEDAPSDRPWCHVASFFTPHYPQMITRELFDHYGKKELPAPLTGLDPLHPRHQHWARCWGFDGFSAEDHRIGRQAYFAMVTHMDQWVGAILDALERSGQAENTLVVYTSDHGEMMGEHGLWGKQVFFEESAAVPMIISGPGLGIQEGVELKTPVSLLDLYPTFRELMGADSWEIPLDGRSLLAACRGEETLQDTPVFCEYAGPDTKGPERMVREKHLKLNYYHHQGMELFDLKKDPHETQDLSEKPEMQSEKNRLLGLLTQDWDPEEIDRNVRLDQQYRTLVTESMHA